MVDYDVVVVGGGHAGLEATLAAARVGAKVLLVTINADSIAHMPCNPAMGGIGKSQVIAEIHALGGVSGILAEEAATSIKVLNRSRGFAVQSTRVQVDRQIYPLLASRCLSSNPNITTIQGMVDELIIDKNRASGVKLLDGRIFISRAVVLTCGTYLGGRLHLSTLTLPGGRWGQPSSDNLTVQLKEMGLPIRRFNTGTTPRADSRTIDYDELERQDGDSEKCSLVSEYHFYKNQLPSYLGRTNARTFDIIKKYMHLAPSVAGHMVKVGPRTCPSLEEKARWYPDRMEHMFFVEPESRYTNEVYLQGMYMSIPAECQLEVLRTLPGMSRVAMVRPGYAIDYDFVDPIALNPTLATKMYSNLFLAGQLNGTTGYDEAASLGLIAGANAALLVLGLNPLVINRDDGYIGVMIDDLTHKGLNEPYRITPSHVEYRISLRADNALFRLGQKGQQFGLLSSDRSMELNGLSKDRDTFISIANMAKFYPTNEMNELLHVLDLGDISEPMSLNQLIRRPTMTYQKLATLVPQISELSERAVRSAMSDIAYDTYLKRETSQISDIKRWSTLSLPIDLDYNSIVLISKQARERLDSIRPKTLKEAMSVDGITFADIEVLARYVSRETNL